MSLLFCKALSNFFWLNRQHFDGLVEKSKFLLLVVMAVFVILPSNYYFSLIVIAVPKTKFSVLLFILNKLGQRCTWNFKTSVCHFTFTFQSLTLNLKEGFIYTGKINNLPKLSRSSSNNKTWKYLITSCTVASDMR